MFRGNQSFMQPHIHTFIHAIRIPSENNHWENVCHSRYFFPAFCWSLFLRIVHGTRHASTTIGLLSMSMYANDDIYSSVHSFEIIQIFSAQTNNSNNDQNADDDGNLTNRLQFSAFAHTKSKWTYGLWPLCKVVRCSLSKKMAFYGLNSISILHNWTGPLARISANKNLNC